MCLSFCSIIFSTASLVVTVLDASKLSRMHRTLANCQLRPHSRAKNSLPVLLKRNRKARAMFWQKMIRTNPYVRSFHSTKMSVSFITLHHVPNPRLPFPPLSVHMSRSVLLCSNVSAATTAFSSSPRPSCCRTT